VLFDVYDNDNRRNNPSIFVIKQSEGEVRNFNHDQDFDTDMLTQSIAGLPPFASKTNTHSYKCVADIRNTGKISRVVVKFLHKVLHVYIDTGDGTGFKFCLSVGVNDDLKDHHLAFTAATGQVADQMDLFEVTTRYLKEADQEFDDESLAQLGDVGKSRPYTSILWFAASAICFGLIALTAYEWYTCRNMVSDQIDPVRICDELNKYVVLHYVVHFILTLVYMISVATIPVLLNVPLALWRGWLLFKKKYQFSPASLSAISSKGHGIVGVHPSTQLLVTLLIYVASELVYIIQLLRE